VAKKVYRDGRRPLWRTDSKGRKLLAGSTLLPQSPKELGEVPTPIMKIRQPSPIQGISFLDEELFDSETFTLKQREKDLVAEEEKHVERENDESQWSSPTRSANMWTEDGLYDTLAFREEELKRSEGKRKIFDTWNSWGQTLPDEYRKIIIGYVLEYYSAGEPTPIFFDIRGRMFIEPLPKDANGDRRAITQQEHRDQTFVHLFSDAQYDEWADRALEAAKLVWDLSNGEEGVNKIDYLTPHRLVLSESQYSNLPDYGIVLENSGSVAIYYRPEGEDETIYGAYLSYFPESMEELSEFGEEIEENGLEDYLIMAREEKKYEDTQGLTDEEEREIRLKAEAYDTLITAWDSYGEDPFNLRSVVEAYRVRRAQSSEDGTPFSQRMLEVLYGVGKPVEGIVWCKEVDSNGFPVIPNQ
jgi:hypothetical protein